MKNKLVVIGCMLFQGIIHMINPRGSLQWSAGMLSIFVALYALVSIVFLLTNKNETVGKGKMKMNMELTGIDEPLEKIGVYVKYVVLSLIACVLFIGSCILAGYDIAPKTENNMPLISIIGIVFAIALAIYSVRKLTKKK